MKKYTLSAVFYFFLATFLVTWVFWSLPLLFQYGFIADLPNWWGFGGFAPSVLGVLFVGYIKGKSGLKELFNRLIAFKANLKTYFLVVLLPLFLVAITLISSWLLFDVSFHWDKLPEIYIVPILFIQILFLGGPLNEELGWRGFALPALLERYSFSKASTIIGVLWALWHLPLFFAEIPGYTAMPFYAYLVNTVALSFIFSYVYVSGKQQLWLCVLLHALLNTTNWLLIPLIPEEMNTLVTTIYAVFTALTAFWIIKIEPLHPKN